MLAVVLAICIVTAAILTCTPTLALPPILTWTGILGLIRVLILAASQGCKAQELSSLLYGAGLLRLQPPPDWLASCYMPALLAAPSWAGPQVGEGGFKREVAAR